MAYEIVGKTDGNHIAAADLSTHQYKFCVLDANQQVALASALGQNAYGVLQNKPLLGQSAALWLDGSHSKVVAGAAIAVNAQVTTAADGRAVTAAATQVILGRAMTPAAAAGEIITVYLEHAGVA